MNYAPPVPTSFCQAFKFSNSIAILTHRSFSILAAVFLLQQTCRQQEGVRARLLWVTECCCCKKLDAWWNLLGPSCSVFLLMCCYSWFQGFACMCGRCFLSLLLWCPFGGGPSEGEAVMLWVLNQFITFTPLSFHFASRSTFYSLWVYPEGKRCPSALCT